MITIKKLSKKHLNAIEYMVQNLTLTDQQYADALGVDRRSIINWKRSPVFQEALDARLKEVFKGNAQIAVNRILNIIETGKDNDALNAAKYLLDYSGYQAKQQVEVESESGLSINVNISND